MTDRLARRLVASLSAPSQPLLGGDQSDGAAAACVPAAVLVALTDRPEPGVILTVRREHMRTHAGQIAFPGGRVDPGEVAVEAAIREAREELGLDARLVEPVATLDDYRTITNFVVTPVLAVVPPDLPLYPHEHEVADWFEAPLPFLLDPANHKAVSAVFAGRERRYWQIEWKDRRIWGATAAMLVNLSRRLRWS